MASIPKKTKLRRSKSAPNLTANTIMTLKPPTTTPAHRERLARLDAGGAGGGGAGGSSATLATLRERLARLDAGGAGGGGGGVDDPWEPGITKEEFRKLARKGVFGSAKEAMHLRLKIFPRGRRFGGSRRRRRHKRKTKRKTKRRRRRRRRTHRRRRKRKTKRR